MSEKKICKDCVYFNGSNPINMKGLCALHFGECCAESEGCCEYSERADLHLSKNGDYISGMTDEQREQVFEAVGKAVDAITEALEGFTNTMIETLKGINYNSLLEAMMEVQNAGDNNNSDNMRNIGDDKLDQ